MIYKNSQGQELKNMNITYSKNETIREKIKNAYANLASIAKNAEGVNNKIKPLAEGVTEIWRNAIEMEVSNLKKIKELRKLEDQLFKTDLLALTNDKQIKTILLTGCDTAFYGVNSPRPSCVIVLPDGSCKAAGGYNEGWTLAYYYGIYTTPEELLSLAYNLCAYEWYGKHFPESVFRQILPELKEYWLLWIDTPSDLHKYGKAYRLHKAKPYLFNSVTKSLLIKRWIDQGVLIYIDPNIESYQGSKAKKYWMYDYPEIKEEKEKELQYFSNLDRDTKLSIELFSELPLDEKRKIVKVVKNKYGRNFPIIEVFKKI